MKKIIIVLGLLLFVNVNTVEATDFEESFAGIAVFVDNTSGTNIDGHIDLLVLKSDFEELQESAKKSQADLDYFNFQFKQLEEARLEPDEQENDKQEPDEKKNYRKRIRRTL